MNPVRLKISISALSLLVMALGAVVMASSMQDGANSLGMTLGALLILVPASVMVTRLPRLWRYQVQTRDWYQTTYPAAVSGERVACFSCGSDDIETHTINRQTGHNGHICGQCDTTLFYS
ncbi:hypothetical protein [Marinobacter mobilis]|nr:hypothetical protein [Marinobacter mobilis]